MNKPLFTYIKWIILIAAYSFLFYKLFTFKHYPELLNAWHNNELFNNWFYFIGVLLLLPFNWLLETFKWKYLLRNIEILSLKSAFKSVMIGNAAAFFTPNRLGEFPGRALALSTGNKTQGASTGILGSISQSITILIFGIPSLLLLLNTKQLNNYTINLWLIISLFLILLCSYFLLPLLSKHLNSFKRHSKINDILDKISQFSSRNLLEILMLSFIRYIIFCTQFFLLLQFMNVNLSIYEGIIAIATNYLFITFTPSLSFSEGAIRASIAVLIIGLFSDNMIGIIAAGLGIWLINFVIPMLLGSSLILKKD